MINVINEWPLTPAICLLDGWSHLFPAARASVWKDENTEAAVPRDGETTGRAHALSYGPDHQLKSFPGEQAQRYMISILAFKSRSKNKSNLSLAKCTIT